MSCVQFDYIRSWVGARPCHVFSLTTLDRGLEHGRVMCSV